MHSSTHSFIHLFKNLFKSLTGCVEAAGGVDCCGKAVLLSPNGMKFVGGFDSSCGPSRLEGNGEGYMNGLCAIPS